MEMKTQFILVYIFGSLIGLIMGFIGGRYYGAIECIKAMNTKDTNITDTTDETRHD